MYFQPEFIQFCFFCGVVAIFICLISSRRRVTRGELLGCWELSDEIFKAPSHQRRGYCPARLCFFEDNRMVMEVLNFKEPGGQGSERVEIHGTWFYQVSHIVCRTAMEAGGRGISMRIKVHEFDDGQLILSSGDQKQRWRRSAAWTATDKIWKVDSLDRIEIETE